MRKQSAAIQVQEFATPNLTAADHAAFDRGYRESMRRHGIDVTRNEQGGRFPTAAERQANRRSMAVMFEDGGAE